MPARPSLGAGRIAFDVLFGVLLPAACFLADPLLFRDGSLTGLPLLPPAWRVPVGALCSAAILGLLLFLDGRGRGDVRSMIAATPLLLLGAVVALVLAAALLPVVLPTSLLLVGLPGLVPVVTGYVYLRAFVEAARSAKGRTGVVLAALLPCLVLLAVGTPLVQAERMRRADTDRILERVVPRLVESGDEEDLRLALEIVRDAHPDFRPTPYRPLYAQVVCLPADDPRHDRWGVAYREIVGRDLGEDSWRYID